MLPFQVTAFAGAVCLSYGICQGLPMSYCLVAGHLRLLLMVERSFRSVNLRLIADDSG